MVKVWASLDSPHDFRYIRRSLPSLLESDLPDTARVIVIDDQSTDPRLARLLDDLRSRHDTIEVWRNPERLGPNRGQEYNFPKIVDRFPKAEFFVLCDDDVIYHPGWLQRLAAVYSDARARGLLGVFTALNVPARPHFSVLDLPTSTVLLKHRQMALNWLVPRQVYDIIGPFRDVGVAYDTDYGTRLMAREIPIVCLKPSYVQNIGYFGAYQSSDELRAHDFVGRRDLWLWARDIGFAAWRLALAFNETGLGRSLRPYLKRLFRRAKP
jgi:glycosyltransferase involved in cell wall biosynthesis